MTLPIKRVLWLVNIINYNEGNNSGPQRSRYFIDKIEELDGSDDCSPDNILKHRFFQSLLPLPSMPDILFRPQQSTLEI